MSGLIFGTNIRVRRLTFHYFSSHSTIPSFAIFLRSMLNHSAATPGGPPILSRKLWDEASTDGLQRVELELPVPVIKSSDPQMTCDLERETTPKGDPVPEGWTLLQAALTNTAVSPLPRHIQDIFSTNFLNSRSRDGRLGR